MEYMGDRKFWDRKFSARSRQPLPPEQSLVENLSCFKKGTVLDIACGDGRNALFLLDNHFSLTGIDFSRIALDRLEWFASVKNAAVKTKQADLSQPEWIKEIGFFDNMVINHYRLKKEHLAALVDHISGEGILFVCGFGHKHTDDAAVRHEDLIQPEDFHGLQDFMDPLLYEEAQNEHGFIVTYVFRKR